MQDYYGLILDNNHALGLLIVSNDDWSKNLFLIHPQDNETFSKVPPCFQIRYISKALHFIVQVRIIFERIDAISSRILETTNICGQSRTTFI